MSILYILYINMCIYVCVPLCTWTKSKTKQNTAGEQRSTHPESTMHPVSTCFNYAHWWLECIRKTSGPRGDPGVRLGQGSPVQWITGSPRGFNRSVQKHGPTSKNTKTRWLRWLRRLRWLLNFQYHQLHPSDLRLRCRTCD